ncbi:MAG: KGK domain-containing protein [Coleofasciculaceae cyanobacterium]
MAVGWWYERLNYLGIFSMEEKFNNGIWQLLDGDKDVLLINGEAFIVSGFKELIEKELSQKFNHVQTNYNGQFVPSLKTIKLGKTELKLDNIIKWNFDPEGVSAELLKVGSKGWEKGKIKIQSSIKIETNHVKAEVDIEFSPDEPPKPESPLDDLRELPEYKQQA